MQCGMYFNNSGIKIDNFPTCHFYLVNTLVFLGRLLTNWSHALDILDLKVGRWFYMSMKFKLDFLFRFPSYCSIEIYLLCNRYEVTILAFEALGCQCKEEDLCCTSDGWKD